jgi:hypothetical protein
MEFHELKILYENKIVSSNQYKIIEENKNVKNVEIVKTKNNFLVCRASLFQQKRRVEDFFDFFISENDY